MKNSPGSFAKSLPLDTPAVFTRFSGRKKLQHLTENYRTKPLLSYSKPPQYLTGVGQLGASPLCGEVREFQNGAHAVDRAAGGWHLAGEDEPGSLRASGNIQ